MPKDRRANADVQVCAVGPDAVVGFAAEELAERLGRITGRTVSLVKDDAARRDAISVGLMSAFPQVARPSVADPRFDDAIAVDVTQDSGVIAGVNGRSALLAVYRYLTELGCRWVRPGADGEYVPRLRTLPSVRLQETPSYRHRAVCIEGAVSYEHVCDMVDWLPKLGFNGYFVQFREAHTFFDRWYSHLGGPDETPSRLAAEKAKEYTAGIENEVKKRGLIYHKVGHGWTCEPFGMAGLGWEKETREPAPEVVRCLALVDGERKLWGGIALNTNLCYSNPDVRRTVVNAIALYAEQHPEIDLLHFWLADGSNNHCECPECSKARPSDFYVRMLNELDAVMAAKGLATRIVFLIYVDLLWPPESETIRNPERFVLMFAPITRTYSRPFRADAQLPELPPYRRNRLEFPKTVEGNVACLRAWQRAFRGDSFDFDYHLMWDHSFDPGHMQIARTLSEDMKGLEAIGLNGYVSCQIQRVFLPTGLAMTVMGRTLWDARAEFDAVADESFRSAFGDEGAMCRAYLALLSDLFDPPYLRGEKGVTSPDNAVALERVPAVIEAFRPVIERNLRRGTDCHAASWRYLEHHADLCEGLSYALAARARGNESFAAEEWQKLKELAWRKERDLHPVLDTWLFSNTLGGKFQR